MTEPEEEQGEQEDGKGWQVEGGLQGTGWGKESKAAFTFEVASELLIPATGPLTMVSLMWQSHLKSWPFPHIASQREGANTGIHILSPQQSSEVS